MIFRIEYSPESEDHLRVLAARQQGTVLDGVVRHLSHQPTIQTRNRKPLRPNPLAPWELRIDDLRVYYDVKDLPDAVVRIIAVGAKTGNGVRIGKEVVNLFMKTVEIKEATASLAHYARAAKHGTVVIIAKGKPVAALVSVDAADMESLSLGTNERFLSIIERSRARLDAEGGISTEEMRSRLGLKAVRQRTRKIAKPKKRSGNRIMAKP